MIILENKNGVTISMDKNGEGHINAICHCGEDLITASPICGIRNNKGNPVLTCNDHFVHAYTWKELVIGIQPEVGLWEDIPQKYIIPPEEPKTYRTTIKDGILTIPDELIEKMDWEVDDDIDIQIINNEIHLKKVEDGKN